MPERPLTRSQAALVVGAPALVVSTIIVFQLLVRLWGPRWGYAAGFGFYWIFWCLLFSLWAVGPRRLARMFRPNLRRWRGQAWLYALLMTLPVLLMWRVAFKDYIGQTTAPVLMVAVVIGLVNGPLEELLWRGAYVAAFPRQPWFAWAYPTVAFATWHLAPQLAAPHPFPGGVWTAIGGALVVGALWGWVAMRSRSILLPTISHALCNMLGFVGLFELGMRV